MFSFFSQLIKQNLYKTFGQLLYLASIDRQEENILLLTNIPDLSKINREFDYQKKTN